MSKDVRGLSNNIYKLMASSSALNKFSKYLFNGKK